MIRVSGEQDVLHSTYAGTITSSSAICHEKH